MNRVRFIEADRFVGSCPLLNNFSYVFDGGLNLLLSCRMPLLWPLLLLRPVLRAGWFWAGAPLTFVIASESFKVLLWNVLNVPSFCGMFLGHSNSNFELFFQFFILFYFLSSVQLERIHTGFSFVFSTDCRCLKIKLVNMSNCNPQVIPCD